MPKKKKKTFKIGDKAVYPKHGVGVIEKIENKIISGATMSLYVLKILDSDLKLFIPVNNIENAGLREIISKNQIKKVFNILKMKNAPIDTQTWNRRFREYMEKIRGGSIYELAEVLRDLNILKASKALSFGERTMLDKVKGRIIKELALSKGVKEDIIEKEIDSIFR